MDVPHMVTGDLMQGIPSHVVVSKQEAEELSAYMAHQYLDPNTYPAIVQLLKRLEPCRSLSAPSRGGEGWCPL